MPKHSDPLKDSTIHVDHLQTAIRREYFLPNVVQSFLAFCKRYFLASLRRPSETPRLDRGWIIANHKLVSFHAAFLTSLLSIPLHVASKFAVMREMFLSVEVIISSVDLVRGVAHEYRDPRDGALPSRCQEPTI